MTDMLKAVYKNWAVVLLTKFKARFLLFISFLLFCLALLVFQVKKGVSLYM